jgi:hypothetical protein
MSRARNGRAVPTTLSTSPSPARRGVRFLASALSPSASLASAKRQTAYAFQHFMGVESKKQAHVSHRRANFDAERPGRAWASGATIRLGAEITRVRIPPHALSPGTLSYPSCLQGCQSIGPCRGKLRCCPEKRRPECDSRAGHRGVSPPSLCETVRRPTHPGETVWGSAKLRLEGARRSYGWNNPRRPRKTPA